MQIWSPAATPGRSKQRGKSGKHTLIDLTSVQELVSLGRVLRLFQHAAEQLTERSLIVGATARDLILHHVHGLRISRATVDLDIAVAVRSWDVFQLLETNLLRAGARRDSRAIHRLLIEDWKIDVIPFGKVERDGMIVWPETKTTMSVAGFDEASIHAPEVVLPGPTRAFVASPPALLMLKLIAWEERHVLEPRRDAIDIRTLIDSYSEAWNEERLYREADDFLQRFGYDNSLAGAALLGSDAAAIAWPATLSRMREIVERETSGEALILAVDMGRRVEENVALLEAVRAGLHDTALSRR